jgi:hypothetical protein
MTSCAGSCCTYFRKISFASAIRLPCQPATLHSAAALPASTRCAPATTDRTSSLRCQATQSSLDLCQLRRAHDRCREMDSCPDPTPFPTVPAHGCRMKSLSPSRNACVLDHAQSSCASSINLSHLPAASHSDRVIALPLRPLSHPRAPRRRQGTPPRAIPNILLNSIQFA